MDDRIAKMPTGPPRSASTSRTRNTCCCAVVVALGLLLLVAAGCRSGMEADLIARELRTQEDQLYAMDDYLAQYQQLLRQCRAENHALKRQLVERDGELPPPATVPRLRPPPTLAPPPAPANEDLPPLRIDEPRPTLPNDIRIPDVPRLEETTLDEPDAGPPSSHVAASPRRESGIVAASIEPAGHTAKDDHAIREPTGVPTHVWLHGEVVANDRGGGPRLEVDVEPLAQDGHAARFSGSLSLMVLASDELGPRSLARWDFSPDENHAARELSPTGRSMRFHLELPAEVGIDKPTELWVRLLPDEGPKLLSHAALDLREPARFSSLIDPQRASDEATHQEERVMRIGRRDQFRSHRGTPIDISDGTWSVVRPGVVSQPPQRQNQPSGAWRTTSAPLPMIAAPRAAVPRAAVQQTAYLESPKAAPTIKREAPAWSPDR